jgi:outer membrane protein insertion porin family
MNPAGAFVYITAMSRLPLVLLCLAAASAPALAQDTTPLGSCAVPDSIAVRGNEHVDEATIRGDAGLVAGANLNYRDIQRALRAIFATGQFDDVKITCTPAAGQGTRTIVAVTVKERPVLSDVRVEGTDRVSKKSVRDRIEIPEARPLNPALVSRAVQRIDSLYESRGYYLARVKPETTFVGPQIRLTFKVDEGRRLAVSGIRINGNNKISDGEIVDAMQTKPEGFLWYHKGAFDEDKFAGDLGDRIAALYGKRGYIDFQVIRDTMIVDRENGKALIEITVAEGPQYRVGTFTAEGNKRFSTEEVLRFYPFNDYTRPITSRITSGLGLTADPTPKGVFDKERWDESFNNISTAYRNEGYIQADLRPVIERRVAQGDTSQHVVDLRWVIDEKSPSIINRIEILGNDYTVDSCIRDQLVIIPGNVYNQEALIRSWQSIGNLGFFETPVPPPDTRPANEQGDVDIIFNVKEKRTGNVNFGASVGQGLGVGGFIGLDQPNLFGRCKRGSLQWQFGRYVNDFNLSYSDPALRQTRISGTVSAYRSQARYTVADLGRSLRTGGSVEIGFPVPRSPFSRLRFSYGAEVVSFGSTGLLGEQSSIYGNSSFRSTLGTTAMHDTRSDMPFPTAGGMQSLSAQFSGGPLGGTYNFQQYRAETRAYAPLGQIGGKAVGGQPMKFVLGLSSHAGVVTGNTGPFFFSQEFALGGVQYGEQLRGYDEFSISPRGYVVGTDNFNATRTSFGKAFFTATAELGLRVNQSLYGNLFYDVGNVYATARQFDPTRLFRGAGIGVSTITPLGPLGLDYAYGFDRLDRFGNPAPKWQLHFRLGQLF